jgi:hypothetical protein
VYTAYPSGESLRLFLEDAGMVPPLDLPGAVRAGIQGFERDCDRHFLAGLTIENEPAPDEVRRFDPATVHRQGGWGGAFLDFGPYGDLNAITSVVYAPANAPPETLAEGTDYWPLPANAPATGFPWTGMEFRRRFWAPLLYHQHHALEITGSWGFGTTLPADAWRAMLIRSATLALTSISTSAILSIAGGGLPLTGWKEADVSEDYAIVPFSTVMTAARASWKEDYMAAISAYRRVEF